MREHIFGLETEYSLSHMPEPDHPRVDSREVSKTAIRIANHRLSHRGDHAYFWCNAGKLYYDVGHVEWATPECRTVRDAIIYDKAGERLLAQLAAETESTLSRQGRPGTLFVAKNNVDAHGNTFGCHENYLILRKSPFIPDPSEFFDYTVRMLVPFLVSRTVICGSGRTTPEGFHLSQRASFVGHVLARDARQERAIINTRDEPHAARDEYRRLHLILGDANMAEWAAFLKLGTTALVLAMIEDSFLDDVPQLHDPVGALHAISGDPSLTVKLRLRNGGRATALEIQRYYLEAAEQYLAGCADAEPRLILETWAETLAKLEDDPQLLVGRLDWVTKQALLQEYGAEQLGWGDPGIQELDFRYHDVRPDSSVFATLEEAGLIQALLDPGEIEAAMTRSPISTRARIRAEAIDHGLRIPDWDTVQSVGDSSKHRLPDPFDWCPTGVLRALDKDDAALLAYLQRGLDSKNPAVRIQALQRLGQLGDNEVGRLICGALDDTDYEVRAAAAEALGQRRDRHAIAPLEKAARDPHFVVRWQAEEALRALGAAR